MRRILLTYSLVLYMINAVGQSAGSPPYFYSYASPFLLQSPEARGSAMGNTGAASVRSFVQNRNVAALAMLDQPVRFQVSHGPTYDDLADHYSLTTSQASFRLDQRSGISVGFRYNNLGEFTHAGVQYFPNEYSVDLGYAYQIGDRFCLGMGTHLMKLARLRSTSVEYTRALGFDFGVLMKNNIRFLGRQAMLDFGASAANFGSLIRFDKVTYHLPFNARVGASFILPFQRSSLNLQAEFAQRFSYVTEGNWSLDNAPRQYGVGVEYSILERFVFRGGYSFGQWWTSEAGSNISGGVGVRYRRFGIDFAINEDLSDERSRNPAAGSYQVTLNLSFEGRAIKEAGRLQGQDS